MKPLNPYASNYNPYSSDKSFNSGMSKKSKLSPYSQEFHPRNNITNNEYFHRRNNININNNNNCNNNEYFVNDNNYEYFLNDNNSTFQNNNITNISNDMQSISLHSSSASPNTSLNASLNNYSDDNTQHSFRTVNLTEKQVDEHRECLLNLNQQIQDALKSENLYKKHQKNKSEKQKVSQNQIYDNDDNYEKKAESQILNIWSSNLNEAIQQIELIIHNYKYIAIDTEFPGVVSKSHPADAFHHWFSTGYKLVSKNVNILKLIQLGLTFYNEKGETPQPYSTFQFNFQFDLSCDMFAPDSIQLLINCGIDFNKLNKCGIQHKQFAEIITMSGLVLNDDVTWICFHGSYDFAYLIKTLCCRNLPSKESNFFAYLQTYFPLIYDLKVLLRNVHFIKDGGLQKVANKLNVKRIGKGHMAGSDSLLTGNVFFKLRELDFEKLVDQRKYLNTLYGLNMYALNMPYISCNTLQYSYSH